MLFVNFIIYIAKFAVYFICAIIAAYMIWDMIDNSKFGKYAGAGGYNQFNYNAQWYITLAIMIIVSAVFLGMIIIR